MKWPAVILALTAVEAVGATAYVTDELVLGVYAEENNQGQRLATLHSGSSLETLSVSGEFTQVRLPDGTTGWVKSAYLVTKEPATVRVKQLEEELDRAHATTPGLAEAAARSEVERLKAEIDALRAERAPAAAAQLPLSAASVAPRDAASPRIFPASAWALAPALIAALAIGFWLGYATLARRVKQKFGGIKVY